MIDDPRIEYQKLIDQNNRFFLTVLAAIFSLIATIYLNDIGLKKDLKALLSMMLTVLSLVSNFIWTAKNQIYINKQKSIVLLIEDESFKKMIALEEQLDKDDFYSKGWFNRIDLILPRLLVFISGIAVVVSVITLLILS